MTALIRGGPEDSERANVLPVLTVRVEKDLETLVNRFLARKREDLATVYASLGSSCHDYLAVRLNSDRSCYIRAAKEVGDLFAVLAEARVKAAIAVITSQREIITCLFAESKTDDNYLAVTL